MYKKGNIIIHEKRLGVRYKILNVSHKNSIIMLVRMDMDTRISLNLDYVERTFNIDKQYYREQRLNKLLNGKV